MRADGEERDVAALKLAAVSAKCTGFLFPHLTAAPPDSVYLEGRCWLWRYGAYPRDQAPSALARMLGVEAGRVKAQVKGVDVGNEQT